MYLIMTQQAFHSSLGSTVQVVSKINTIIYFFKSMLFISNFASFLLFFKIYMTILWPNLTELMYIIHNLSNWKELSV